MRYLIPALMLVFGACVLLAVDAEDAPENARWEIRQVQVSYPIDPDSNSAKDLEARRHPWDGKVRVRDLEVPAKVRELLSEGWEPFDCAGTGGVRAYSLRRRK